MTHYIKTSDLMDNLRDGLEAATYRKNRTPPYAKKLQLVHEGAIATLEILIEYYEKNPGEELVIDGEIGEDPSQTNTDTSKATENSTAKPSTA